MATFQTKIVFFLCLCLWTKNFSQTRLIYAQTCNHLNQTSVNVWEGRLYVRVHQTPPSIHPPQINLIHNYVTLVSCDCANTFANLLQSIELSRIGRLHVWLSVMYHSDTMMSDAKFTIFLNKRRIMRFFCQSGTILRRTVILCIRTSNLR